MAIPRFFCPEPLQAHAATVLPEHIAHHAVRVLRLKPGAPIVLFDGRGGQYPALLRMEGRLALADVGEYEFTDTELAGRITLVQGIASGDKMDWIVEKAVELGAVAIQPIAARRSVLQLSGDRLEKRLTHWRRVAQAAAEQSGRNRLMAVNPPLPLQSWLESAAPDPASTLLCDPEAGQPLAEALKNVKSELALLIGPAAFWQPRAAHGNRRPRADRRQHSPAGVGLASRILPAALRRPSHDISRQLLVITRSILPRRPARLGIGVFARMLHHEAEQALVVGGEFRNIAADLNDCLGVFLERGVARMQPMEPQEQAIAVVEHGIAQTVIERVEVAPEILRKVDRLDDCPQDSGTAARPVAIDDEGGHAGLLRRGKRLGLRNGRIDQTAFLQFHLQRLRLAHCCVSLKNAFTSSTRLMLSARPRRISAWVKLASNNK
jgi:16S rRNA (uracil1498-N3)-methyltransferase